MAHCGTSDIREVLGVGSATEFNLGTADMIAKRTTADLLIDERLALYDLTVSGTAQDLIVCASKYWTSALYKQDYYIRREKAGKEEMVGKSKVWWETGSMCLSTYITKQTEEYDKLHSRLRRVYSTTTKNP